MKAGRYILNEFIKFMVLPLSVVYPVNPFVILKYRLIICLFCPKWKLFIYAFATIKETQEAL